MSQDDPSGSSLASRRSSFQSPPGPFLPTKLVASTSDATPTTRSCCRVPTCHFSMISMMVLITSKLEHLAVGNTAVDFIRNRSFLDPLKRHCDILGPKKKASSLHLSRPFLSIITLPYSSTSQFVRVTTEP